MGSGDACLCILYIVQYNAAATVYKIIPLGEEKVRFLASLTHQKPFFHQVLNEPRKIYLHIIRYVITGRSGS